MKPIIVTVAALCASWSFASNAVDMNGRIEWEWAYSTAQHRQQKNQLQQMTNFVLWVVIVLGLLVALLLIYHIKKKKEKETSLIRQLG